MTAPPTHHTLDPSTPLTPPPLFQLLEETDAGGHSKRSMSVPQGEITASMLSAMEDEEEDVPKKNRILMELGEHVVGVT